VDGVAAAKEPERQLTAGKLGAKMIVEDRPPLLSGKRESMNRIAFPLLLGLSLAPVLCWAAEPDDQAKAIAEIEKLGGEVTRAAYRDLAASAQSLSASDDNELKKTCKEQKQQGNALKSAFPTPQREYPHTDGRNKKHSGRM
jgi:hypothetical protein